MNTFHSKEHDIVFSLQFKRYSLIFIYIFKDYHLQQDAKVM